MTLILPMMAAQSSLPLDWAAASVYSVGGTARLLSSYPASSPLITLQRSSDNATLDFADSGTGWVSAAAITAWLGGATGYITQVYDQGGNSRYFSQSLVANAPVIDTTLSQPSMKFTASSSQFLAGNGMGAFTQNVGSATLVCVRARTSTAAADACLAISTGISAGSGRAVLQSTSTLFTSRYRRLDADGGVNSTGIASNTNWGVELCGFDWTNAYSRHRIDGTDDSTATGSSGNTSNTAALTTGVGGYGAGGLGATSYLTGRITAYAFLNGLPSPTQLVSSLASCKLS